MNFDQCISKDVDTRTLVIFKNLIASLTLLAWGLMIFLMGWVKYAWVIYGVVISPYVVFFGLVIYQVLAYIALDVLTLEIDKRADPTAKFRITFQRVSTYFVMPIAFLAVIAWMGYSFLNDANNNYERYNKYIEQVAQEFSKLTQHECKLDHHSIRYNVFLKPIVVTQERTQGQYSVYLNDEYSLAKNPVEYDCVTHGKISSRILFRSLMTAKS